MTTVRIADADSEFTIIASKIAALLVSDDGFVPFCRFFV